MSPWWMNVKIWLQKKIQHLSYLNEVGYTLLATYVLFGFLVCFLFGYSVICFSINFLINVIGCFICLFV